MNSWDAPKLSDLKITPAPKRRTRSAFELLGEPQDSDELLDLATQEVAAIAPPPPFTERVVLDGQVVDVITGTPPPVRRHAAPRPPNIANPRPSFSGLSFDEDSVPLTDEETDDMFDSWTMEPAANRGGFPQVQGRGKAIGVGVFALAVAVALFAWVASDIVGQGTDANTEVAAAEVAEAAAVAPVVVETATEIRAEAPEITEEPQAEEVVAKSAPQAALKKTNKAKPVRRAPIAAASTYTSTASSDHATPSGGQGWEEPQLAERNTMYTPNGDAEAPVEEEPEPVQAPEASPEVPAAPETSGRDPWAKKVDPGPAPAPETADPADPWSGQ